MSTTPSATWLNTFWSSPAAEEASKMFALASCHETTHYLAQRTLIDVEELTARLQFLASNPTVARRMGDCGRRRVIERFSWPIVSQQFLQLWRSQIAQARQQPAPRRPVLSLDRIFGHYASDAVSHNDLLVKTNSPFTADEIPDHWALSSDAEYEGICEILDRCAHNPVRIGDLLRDGMPDACVAWVVKKGFCRLISSSSTHHP